MEPITINGVIQVGATVEFYAYADNSLTDRQLLQKVVTDGNGVATLTEAIPAGKQLAVSVQVVDGDKIYQRFRMLN